jgi:hypothetical protein
VKPEIMGTKVKGSGKQNPDSLLNVAERGCERNTYLGL